MDIPAAQVAELGLDSQGVRKERVFVGGGFAAHENPFSFACEAGASIN